MTEVATRPITLLIAALGGEGGGVLTNWIVSAATDVGLPTQSTSIPGVAQRTGATTYYIEILPTPASELGARRPVFALMPGIGDVDLMVASEFLEAGRAVANGFVTPDRTFLIASTHRFFAMTEKTAMGDGRVDPGRLLKAFDEHAQHHLLLDMEEIAQQSGSMINAVMLGLIAGSGRLPMAPDSFERAIRAEGKEAESNLRGFKAGLDAARAHTGPGAAARSGKRWRAAAPSLEALESEAGGATPETARDVIVEGLRRLNAYQDLAYARHYLDRLMPVREADDRAGAGGQLLRETARHLAQRMSFEDLIRVAQAKIAPDRFRRIAEEVRAAAGEPVIVHDFFKPGIEEICSLLPPSLARPMLSLSARLGWLDRVYWGMEVNSTSMSGYLRLTLLAKLRPWRRRSHRYREEQAAIEAWLKTVLQAAKLSPALALEIADCARLIKGYGDTHRRGTANYQAIDARVIRPALGGRFSIAQAIDAIASARTAALADPDGASLGRCLAEIEQRVPLDAAAE